MQQQSFNFTDVTAIELKDSNGSVFPFNRYTSPLPAIMTMGKVSKKKATWVLEELEKEYEVYACRDNELALVKDGVMAYHFLYGGGIWWKGEYIQNLNEWDFRHLIEGQKVKNHKAPKTKLITVTATERQIRKAKQLFYARSIGFNIRGKDYQRWHLL